MMLFICSRSTYLVFVTWDAPPPSTFRPEGRNRGESVASVSKEAESHLKGRRCDSNLITTREKVVFNKLRALWFLPTDVVQLSDS